MWSAATVAAVTARGRSDWGGMLVASCLFLNHVGAISMNSSNTSRHGYKNMQAT
ncbi:hypothetical protein PF003_g17308 [Phytophthora fragariae]|nr:hypothetical protein PF003_g17308 [Phytophthora fragariae]